jgi:hypothetical protein
MSGQRVLAGYRHSVSATLTIPWAAISVYKSVCGTGIRTGRVPSQQISSGTVPCGRSHLGVATVLGNRPEALLAACLVGQDGRR